MLYDPDSLRQVMIQTRKKIKLITHLNIVRKCQVDLLLWFFFDLYLLGVQVGEASGRPQ